MENIEIFLNILKIFIDPFVIIPTLVVSCALFFLTYSVVDKDLKKERTQSLVVPGLRQSVWITVGGKETNRYYDLDKASASLDDMEKIAKWYIDNIKELKDKTGVDYLAFIERDAGPVGAITKKDLLSHITGIPSFVVRPKRRIMASVMKGADSVADTKVVIVSDVATTGTSIIKVVDILESHKAKVIGAITVLNRGGREVEEALKKKCVEFRFAAELSDIKSQALV